MASPGATKPRLLLVLEIVQIAECLLLDDEQVEVSFLLRLQRHRLFVPALAVQVQEQALQRCTRR
jgi:hypothetical protein